MLIMDPGAWDEMLEHCGTQSPKEAVGALLGVGRKVFGVQPMTNVSDAPEHHYEVDPIEMALLYGVVDAVEGNVDVLGFYHSHPRTEAVPSPADLEFAHPGMVYVICSLGPRTAGHVTAFMAGGETMGVQRGG